MLPPVWGNDPGQAALHGVEVDGVRSSFGKVVAVDDVCLAQRRVRTPMTRLPNGTRVA